MNSKRRSSDGAAAASLSLNTNELLSLLSGRLRRSALRSLAAADGPVAIADLSRDVVRALEDRTDAEPSTDTDLETVRAVEVELYHCHLPKLADHGLVAVDRDRNAVELRSAGEAIVERLEAEPNGIEGLS